MNKWGNNAGEVVENRGLLGLKLQPIMELEKVLQNKREGISGEMSNLKRRKSIVGDEKGVRREKKNV